MGPTGWRGPRRPRPRWRTRRACRRRRGRSPIRGCGDGCGPTTVGSASARDRGPAPLSRCRHRGPPEGAQRHVAMFAGRSAASTGAMRPAYARRSPVPLGEIAIGRPSDERSVGIAWRQSRTVRYRVRGTSAGAGRASTADAGTWPSINLTLAVASRASTTGRTAPLVLMRVPEADPVARRRDDDGLP